MSVRGTAGRRARRPADRAVLRRALAVGEFRGLVLAQVTSETGDQIARLALALVVLERTGSAFGAAATFAIAFVPAFFGAALLGPLADRFSRRTLMLGADLGRAVIIGVLALVATTDASLPLLLLLLLLAEFLTPAFDAARSAVIPSILGEPEVVSAGYGLSRMLGLANQVLGLVAGGVIITLLSTQAALAIDAVSFLVSFVVIVVSMRSRRAAIPGPTTPAALWRDLHEGAAVLWADRSRRALVVLACALVATVVAPETLGLAYARSVGAPDWWAGVLMAAPIAGATVGTVMLSRAPLRRQLDLILPLSVAGAVPLLVTGIEPPLPLLVLMWAFAGAMQAYFVSIIAITTLLTRDEHRGRIAGLAAAAFAACSLAGTLFAGLVGDWTSPAFAVTLIACLGLVVSGVGSMLWPERVLRRDVDALGAA